jgi:hypothetical protein
MFSVQKLLNDFQIIFAHTLSFRNKKCLNIYSTAEAEAAKVVLGKEST